MARRPGNRGQGVFPQRGAAGVYADSPSKLSAEGQLIHHVCTKVQTGRTHGLALVRYLLVTFAPEPILHGVSAAAC